MHGKLRSVSVEWKAKSGEQRLESRKFGLCWVIFIQRVLYSLSQKRILFKLCAAGTSRVEQAGENARRRGQLEIAGPSGSG